MTNSLKVESKYSDREVQAELLDGSEYVELNITNTVGVEDSMQFAYITPKGAWELADFISANVPRPPAEPTLGERIRALPNGSAFRYDSTKYTFFRTSQGVVSQYGTLYSDDEIEDAFGDSLATSLTVLEVPNA